MSSNLSILPTTIKVRLRKDSSCGLGIVVTPRLQTHGLDIEELVPGGVADTSGLLRPGDRLLKVGDKSLDNLPYDKCLQILQGIQPDSEVDLLLQVPDGLSTRILSSVDQSGQEKVTRVTEPLQKPRTTDSGAQTTVNFVAPSDRRGSRGLQNDVSAARRVSNSPDRPASLYVSGGQSNRKHSITSPSRRPVRLRNIITGNETLESLVLKASEQVHCSPTKCMGSLMSGPPRRPTISPRTKDEVITHAKQFFDQYYMSIKRFNSSNHERRWEEVVDEVDSTGTYTLRETELVYGAKLAWRNAPRCIGRIQWSKLQVFDARYVTTTREMFDAICNHIKYGTNKGNIRSAITIFPQRTDGLHDFRIWNTQLIMYAGYRKPDGTVLGDPASADFTELCLKLGWESKRTRWDILPLVLSANGHDPQVYDLPEELILRVPITHPKYAWFADMDLQWYGLPAVSSMLFDVGGIEFPATPFNGWYMVTEIGSRDLCDTHRFNILEDVASRLGVDTRAPSTLWKDRVVLEVNIAVIHSFQKANVTIVDHHTASESFMKHYENEFRLRGGCPADWVWIVPPMSSSLTPVFHQEMLYYSLKPSYEYQDPAWKTHIWEKDREKNGPRTPSKKYKFKEVARAVKFGQSLFGMALSKRIKATVLFGTETGRSESYAKTLGQTFSHAFNVNVICMSDYDIINLEHETLLLVVTSTFGNGDPPENGQGFARNLQAIKITGDSTPDVSYMSGICLPFVRMNSVSVTETSDGGMTPGAVLDSLIGPLSNVRFAVFALGSSAYPNFCSFGRYVDNMLTELGGERLVKMGTGDELCGQEHSFSLWAQEVFQVACDVFCVGDEVSLSVVKATLHSETTWSPDKARLVEVKAEKDLCLGLARCTSRKIALCPLKKRNILQSENDSRQTMYLEIGTKNDPNLRYLPGDHVGIYPANRKELVDGILERLQSICPDPDKVVRLELKKEVHSLEGRIQKWTAADHMPPCSFRTALSRYLDITTPPGQQFLRTLTLMATDEADARKIKLLAVDSGRYEDWKQHQQPNFLEVLEDFPSLKPSPAFLFCHLPALQPRFYSISSSPELDPGRIHLTVARVVYQTQSEVMHYGVCSNYLSSAPMESEIACFVRSAQSFRLPDNTSSSIIMIGPGTGIAPFRSFWRQRLLDMQKSPNKKYGSLTLLHGCRSENAELYREETAQMKEDHVLTNLYTAYSRIPDKPKVYVQDILRDLAPTIYKQVVKERAHFYVCGDVSMAEDVNKTIQSLIQEQGRMTTAELELFMKNFQEENRYHEDIFGITLKTAEVTSRGRREAKNRRSTSSS